jgi:hypothetical protein
LDKETEDKIQHVGYEIYMYTQTPSPDKNQAPILNLIFWECRLLHLRNLIQFFSNNNNKNDSFTVNDILPGFKAMEGQSGKPAYKALCKTVFHLSKLRFDKNNKELKDFMIDGVIQHELIDNYYRSEINSFIEKFQSEITRLEEISFEVKQEITTQYKDVFQPNGVTNTTDAYKQVLISEING